MKKYLFFLGMALVALIFSSCNGKKGVFTPTSSGRAYEILVVVDHALWERPAGRALYDVLDTDVPGLPQSERSFRIMYTSPKDYDSTLKLIRNIIIVDVRDIYTKPAFKYAKDVYAAPQLILTIQAPNEQEFEKFVEENKQQIIDFFTRAEMNRQIAQLQHKHNDYTRILAQIPEIHQPDPRRERISSGHLPIQLPAIRILLYILIRIPIRIHSRRNILFISVIR